MSKQLTETQAARELAGIAALVAEANRRLDRLSTAVAPTLWAWIERQIPEQESIDATACQLRATSAALTAANAMYRIHEDAAAASLEMWGPT
jgi:hypothetical protein